MLNGGNFLGAELRKWSLDDDTLLAISNAFAPSYYTGDDLPRRLADLQSLIPRRYFLAGYLAGSRSWARKSVLGAVTADAVADRAEMARRAARGSPTRRDDATRAANTASLLAAIRAAPTPPD